MGGYLTKNIVVPAAKQTETHIDLSSNTNEPINVSSESTIKAPVVEISHTVNEPVV
jgi:hypothetical protein